MKSSLNQMNEPLDDLLFHYHEFPQSFSKESGYILNFWHSYKLSPPADQEPFSHMVTLKKFISTRKSSLIRPCLLLNLRNWFIESADTVMGKSYATWIDEFFVAPPEGEGKV